MSNKNISENLEYFVDNEGIHYEGPLIEITSPSVTINATPVTTGTVTNSGTIHVGPAPQRVLNAIYPRHVTYTVAANCVAGVPLDVDWTTAIIADESFSTPPALPGSTNFVRVRPAAPTDFEFVSPGLYQLMTNATLGAALGDAQRMTIEVMRSFNSGGAYSFHECSFYSKDVGTPTINFVGGHTTDIENINAVPGVERLKVVLTCTENKAVTVAAMFKFMYPQFQV